MTDEEPKIAELSEDEVGKVRALEGELGENVVIIAYDRPLQPATLSQEQVDKLMEVEQELPDAYLVAYRKPS